MGCLLKLAKLLFSNCPVRRIFALKEGEDISAAPLSIIVKALTKNRGNTAKELVAKNACHLKGIQRNLKSRRRSLHGTEEEDTWSLDCLVMIVQCSSFKALTWRLFRMHYLLIVKSKDRREESILAKY
jgi:hypothetical protein